MEMRSQSCCSHQRARRVTWYLWLTDSTPWINATFVAARPAASPPSDGFLAECDSMHVCTCEKSSEYKYLRKALKTSGSQSSTTTSLDSDSRMPLWRRLS